MLYSHYYTHRNGYHTKTQGSAKPYQTKVYNFPPVKVFEDQKGFTFFMPCLPLRHRKGLSVLLGNGMLKFSGLGCEARSGDESVLKVEEDSEEKFHRAFHIAVPVRENAVEIVYEDEFLLVWVPKVGDIEVSLGWGSRPGSRNMESGSRGKSLCLRIKPVGEFGGDRTLQFKQGDNCVKA